MHKKMMKLLLVIFLGTITLMRRAQKNIFTRLETNPSSLLGILPQDEQGFNLRNSVHEGNIQRVISILQGNIKQWSFIEAQLLEPNVNLAMPEIFIPLKHLTTTLEILGNILFMKNEYEDARKCLERACPLMELLPSSIIESFEAAAAGTGQGGVADGVMNEFNFVPENEIDESIREQIILNNQQFTSHPRTGQQYYHTTGKNYAADCFELLRNVYFKLYGLNRTSDDLNDGSGKQSVISDVDDDEGTQELRNHGVAHFSGSYDDLPTEEDEDSLFGSSVLKSDPNSAAFAEIETKIEELRSPFQHLRLELQMVQDRSSSSQRSDGYSDSTIVEEIFDDNEIQLADEDEDEDDVPRGRVPRVGRMIHQTAASKSKSGNANFRNRDKDGAVNLLPSPPSFLEAITRQFSHFFSSPSAPIAPSSPSLIEDDTINMDIDNSESLSATLVSKSFLGEEEIEEDLEYSSSSAFSGLSGSATSIVASDLEVMLRKFVKEDEDGRREIYFLAKKYYDDLEMNFPQMNENEYSANMDLGNVYLELMGRVVEEGFGFVGPELEKWQDIGHSLVTKHIQPSSFPPSDAQEDGSPGSSFGVGIIWEIDPETGKKQEFAVELDGSYFDAFTLQERNRLLVLSAFDIALNLEPYEQFDLSLGFGLGILDNDRSRQRDHASLSFYHQTTPNQQPHLLNVQKPILSQHSQQQTRQKKKTKNSESEEDVVNSPSNKMKKGKRSGAKSFPSSPLAYDSSSPSTATAIPSAVSNSKVDPEVEPSLFMDQTSATLEIPAALRSSVPMIRIENDWTFFLLMAFLVIMVLVVYIAYYQDLLKKRFRQRSTARNQKKTAVGTASVITGSAAVENGYGYYDIVFFILSDWYEFFVPLFSLLLSKGTTLILDIYQLAKVVLSGLIVQLSFLLREKREMIFPSNHTVSSPNMSSTSSPTPSFSVPAKTTIVKKLSEHSSSNGNHKKHGNQQNQFLNSQPTASSLQTISEEVSWQQISPDSIGTQCAPFASSITVPDIAFPASNDQSKSVDVANSTALLAKETKATKRRIVQRTDLAKEEILPIATIAPSSESSSADASSESDFHISDEEMMLRKKQVKSTGKAIGKLTVFSSNEEKAELFPEMIVSEEFIRNQPEQYEALVSSFLAEGQWKEAKKKTAKKSASTIPSHANNNNNNNNSSSSASNSHGTTISAQSNQLHNESRERKSRPPAGATSNHGAANGKFSSTGKSVGGGMDTLAHHAKKHSNGTAISSGNGITSQTSPSAAQARGEENLLSERRPISMSLSLESMLPPAVLEHKASSLPPALSNASQKPWKAVATKPTASSQAVVYEKRTKQSSSPSSFSLNPTDAASFEKAAGEARNRNNGRKTAADANTIKAGKPTVKVSKKSPEIKQSSSNSPQLPAMPGLLPSAMAGRSSTTEDLLPAAVTASQVYPLGVLPHSSASTFAHPPPPGLLNPRVQPSVSTFQTSTYNSLSTGNPPIYPTAATAQSGGSLLSSFLGSHFNADVRSDSGLVGRTASLNEDDGESNELLRGMLDEILRPASPPIMDRLFSTKTSSNEAVQFQSPSETSYSSTYFTSSMNSTQALFGGGNASVDDIISDLSPNAPVFQPNLGASVSSSFPYPRSNLLGDGYWSFSEMSTASAPNNYTNHPSHYLLTTQFDDFLADTLPADSPSPPQTSQHQR